MMGRQFYIVILAAAILSSCCRKPHNLTERKEFLTKYYDSGCFEKEVEKVVNSAIRRYEHRVCCGAQSAVVFDVDDTLLWSYPESKKIEYGFIPKLFHEWVISADQPAVPHVKRLYDFFVKKGCKIIVLTGRRYDEVDATVKNLAKIGVTKIDVLIARSAEEAKLSAAEYKSKHRAELEKQGYRIIAGVGDQESDFTGGCCQFPVKIPNYVYTIY